MKLLIEGIVLAAGRSTRMRRPKALLRVNGATFIERAVRLLAAAGCRCVTAVVAGDDDASAQCAESAGARIVRNPDADSEQAASLRLALDALADDVAGALVLPVDVPGVRLETARALISAFLARGRPIVVPVAAGHPGHPVLLARALFDDVRPAALPEGVRSLIAAHAAEVEEVPVADPGAILDVDTPADLAAWEDAL